MIRRRLALSAAALLAAAGAAVATPLRLDYCVIDQGGGVFQYTFTLTLDNHDNSWSSGQAWRWFIWGDANQMASPLTNWVGDPASLPVGPWTGYTSSGGGHNGPTFNYVLDYWTPPGVGAQLTWNGTSTANLQEGQLLFSTIAGTLNGGIAADFEVAHRLPSCAGQVTGACCAAAGNCFITTQGNCTATGGIYRGDNTTCPANCPQPATGACCLPNLTCVITYQVGCTQQGGAYHGDNSTCAQAGCPQAYQEVGDAGDVPGTAQIPTGLGTLIGIAGALSGSTDVDMYRIRICDAPNFHATLTGGGANWDTMLWLFDATGVGVTMDDDSMGTVQSTITSVNVPGNGDYYLAISGFLRQPNDSSGANLWSSYAQDQRPNGPGAGNPVTGWNGGGASGSYTIFLTGACYPGAAQCYANCDGSTIAPVLTVNDFVCFQSAFAAGASYANCDHSTIPPVLTVNDFVCFQAAFAAGCP